jgi:hypothetical protein
MSESVSQQVSSSVSHDLVCLPVNELVNQSAQSLWLLTIKYIPRAPPRHDHAHGHSAGTDHTERPATEAPH